MNTSRWHRDTSLQLLTLSVNHILASDLREGVQDVFGERVPTNHRNESADPLYRDIQSPATGARKLQMRNRSAAFAQRN